MASCLLEETFAEEISGWAGSLSAWVLFIVPISTMRHIHSRGSVEKFSPVPYLVGSISTALWIAYAVVTPCKNQLLVTNIVGVLLQVSYHCIIYLPTSCIIPNEDCTC